LEISLASGKDSSSSSRNSSEPSGLLYTLLTLFSLLFFLFSWAKPKTHKLKSTIHANQEAEPHRGDGSPQTNIRAKLYTPQSSERYRRANDKRNYAVQKCIAIATWCAFLAAIAYAAVSGYMWSEMRKQTNLQRNGQRSWLGVNGPISSQQIVFSNPHQGVLRFKISGLYFIKNFGHSPATDVAEHVVAYIPLRSDDAAIRPEHGFDCNDDETRKRNGEVVFPDGVVAIGINEEQNLARMQIGPDIPHVWLLGCISYFDTTDTKMHHTRFWQRSYFPLGSEWIAVGQYRYMPIAGFESWGEKTD
jgi:hypothetical protein